MNVNITTSGGRERLRAAAVAGVALLALVCLPAAAVAQTTWSATPTSGLWNVGGNWAGGSAPTTGTTTANSLVFATSNLTTATNNFSSGTFNSITFNSGAPSYTLSGSALTLTSASSQVLNNSSSDQTINFAITGPTNTELRSPNAWMILGTGGSVTPAQNLQIGWQGPTRIKVAGGSISVPSTGAILFRGSGTSTLWVTSGTVSVSGVNGIQMAGQTSNATSVINLDGGVVQTQTLALGNATATTGGTATVNQTGGTLRANTIIKTATAASNMMAINLSGGTIAPNTAALTIGSATASANVDRITLTGNNGTISAIDSVGSATQVTIYTAIGDSGSNFGLTFSGSGGLFRLAAAAANTYTGTTTINSGTLQIGVSGTTGALNASSAITGSSGATLAFARTDDYGGNFGNTISGGLAVRLSSGTLTLGGNNTYSGATTISAGTLQIGVSGTTGALNASSAITGSSGATLAFARTDDYGGNFGNTISGGLAVRLSSGTLTLGGNNTYSDATTISAGMLQFGRTSALYNATTASWTAANLRTGSNATLAFNVGGSGEFTTGNVTTLLTNLAVSTSATNGMNAGSFLGFDTTNASGGTFTIADAIANTTGVSGGARGLRKLGTGILVLGTANTYTGATSVEGGTLAFGLVSGLNSSSGIGINAGAILDYTGTAGTLSRNVTVATSGTGTIRNSGGQKLTLSGVLTKDGRVLRLTGGQFDVTGTIVGSSSSSDLLVDGTSTVTLLSANTYNGPTFVNQASTLVVGTNSAIPSNSIVTLGNATTTGTLSLGTFTNSIGGLVFSGSGGTVRMAANQTASPQLSTASSLSLGSNASLDLAGMATGSGAYKLISYTSRTGTFATVTGLSSDYLLRYDTVTANEITAQRKAEFGTITATPAAATIITGGSTAFGYTVANATPTGGSTLSFTSANGSNVAGSSNGSAGANATSSSISGLVFTGTSVGLSQTGSFTLTDPDAIGSPAAGTVTVNVLNHSLASFDATNTASKTLNFGSYDAGSWSGGDGGNGTLAYSIFNIASLGFTDAQTAGLDLYDWTFTSGDNVFSLGYSPFQNLASGTSNGFSASVLSPGTLAERSYTGTYTLRFRDVNLPGGTNTRDLAVTMNVIVVPEPGALAVAGLGIAAAAWAHRRRSRTGRK